MGFFGNRKYWRFNLTKEVLVDISDNKFNADVEELNVVINDFLEDFGYFEKIFSKGDLKEFNEDYSHIHHRIGSFGNKVERLNQIHKIVEREINQRLSVNLSNEILKDLNFLKTNLEDIVENIEILVRVLQNYIILGNDVLVKSIGAINSNIKKRKEFLSKDIIIANELFNVLRGLNLAQKRKVA